jgi:hypothetical protein
MSTPRGKSPLDAFLPEAAFKACAGGSSTQAYVEPDEVQLDPIEPVGNSPTPSKSGTVEMWPMLAAALIAIGVSMLALAAVAKFGFQL